MVSIKAHKRVLLTGSLAAAVTAFTVTACGGGGTASVAQASAPGHWTQAQVSQFTAAGGASGSDTSCIIRYFERDMSFGNAMDVVSVDPASDTSMSVAQIEAAVVSKYGATEGSAINAQFEQVTTDAGSNCDGSAAPSTAPAATQAAQPAASAASPTPTVSTASPVGTWDVTYGAPAVVSITESGSLYTVTATTAVNVVGSKCYLPVGTQLATFSASGPGTYSGQHGLWSTTDCSFASWTPTTFTLSGSTLTARFSSTSSTPVTFTRAGAAPGAGTPASGPSAGPSSTLTAVPGSTPSSVASGSPVGTWNAQYGYPTVVSITESGSLYTIIATGDVEPVGVSCILPAGTKLATFSATGPGTYSGQQGTWRVSSNHCVFTGWAQATLTLSGTTLRMPSTDPNDPEPITFYKN